MKLTIDGTSYHQFRSYNNYNVVINDIVYKESVLVFPDKDPILWPGSNILEDFEYKELRMLAADNPEIILIGTYPTKTNRKFINLVQSKYIGIEILSIGSACKSFNILSSDGRHTAALILFNT